MKRAVIVLNGDLSQVKIKLNKTDLLMGVDGGTNHILALGLKPDLIIGDLDSLTLIPKNVPLIQYPRDKDWTDMELALKFCQQLEEVVVYGSLGRRLDHVIANILNLQQFRFKIIEANQEIFLLTGPARTSLLGQKGDIVSLIPLSECKKVLTQGLKWGLKEESLEVGKSRGLSNEMIGKKAEIKVKSGKLLIVFSRLVKARKGF